MVRMVESSAPRPRGRLGAIFAVFAVLAAVFPESAANACATGHLGARWWSFQPPLNDLGPAFFYQAVEPVTTSSVAITIKGIGDDCTTPAQPIFATYQVTSEVGAPRSATAADFTAIPPRNTGPLYGYHGPEPTQHDDAVSLLGDALPETVVEKASALISEVTNGRRDIPWEVPLYIIDDDGTDRVSFETAGTYERSETYGVIPVPVFRAGPAAAEASYSIQAAGSSSSPAAADDYQAPGSVSFAAGERVKLVTIQVTNDGKYEPPEELTLTLTDPGTALPDDPVTATVRILDSVGSSGLQSRLHHPRQRWTYPASDYRIREVHIFTLAGQGAPVTSAEFALRKNLRGGTCEWYTGRRFKKGDCQNEKWLGTGQYEPDFFYIRVGEMQPSRGKIKDYTAFSRAQNQTGEVEPFLEKGRNENTFEIKRAKK
jgi:Calx-beta domain-containing protein